MQVAGREVSKDTVFRFSLGTILIVVVTVWTALGIGRPLFASDLKNFEDKIDAAVATAAVAQTNTSIQILNIRRQALQSDLRQANRDVRQNPDADWAQDDVADITEDIHQIDLKIACYRTKGCEVESDI